MGCATKEKVGVRLLHDRRRLMIDKLPNRALDRGPANELDFTNSEGE